LKPRAGNLLICQNALRKNIIIQLLMVISIPSGGLADRALLDDQQSGMKRIFDPPRSLANRAGKDDIAFTIAFTASATFRNLIAFFS
jgi:hypothetical protein